MSADRDRKQTPIYSRFVKEREEEREREMMEMERKDEDIPPRTRSPATPWAADTSSQICKDNDVWTPPPIHQLHSTDSGREGESRGGIVPDVLQDHSSSLIIPSGACKGESTL